MAEIPIDESLLVDCPEGRSIALTKRCEQVLRRLLAKERPPTAIFAVNDCVALHLMEAANNLGVDIPAQLSLVGFDWLLRTLPNGGELTTIAQPFEEIGEIAAERLLDRIKSNKTQSRRKILLDAPLVLRTSTQRPSSCFSSRLSSSAGELTHVP
jgi:LacI family transcriptional regulator